MRAAFTLTPAESRRLIAKGVVQAEEVKRALEKAYLIVTGGVTNALVAQELLGRKNIEPGSNTVGTSSKGVLCVTHPETERFLPLILFHGSPVDITIDQALKDFNRDTVLIKGGNALDGEGNVGVVTAGFDGGTAGKTVGTLISQGLRYIVPIGLEKMVPSVSRAAQKTGAKTLDISLGADFGLFVLQHPLVITEITALKILCGVETYQVAAGGIGGSEGAVVLVVEGIESRVRQAVNLVESIKGEPPLAGLKGKCHDCRYTRCRFNGLTEEQLPEWLK